MLEAALEALPETDSSERARLLATLCSELTYHSPLARRLALADEAKAMARRLGDPATFIDVVTGAAPPLSVPLDGLATESGGDGRGGLAAGLDDPCGPVVRISHVTRFDCALCAGQFELARERLAMLRAMAERLGQPLFLWQAGYRSPLHSPCAR